MKAAVWTDYGKIEVQEMPRPVPGAGEVLLRVHAAGLCITDLHVYTGQFAYGKPPHILGHEIAGEICQTGPGVDEACLGRRVTVETSIGCGHCRFCLGGQRHLCANMTEIGFTPNHGGYAEYVKVPYQNTVPLPDAVSYEEAGIIESVVCPVGSLMRNGVRFGETVAVYGVGPAGLAYIQGARAMGAGKIIAIARNTQRLQRARHFGADVLVNSAEEDVRQAVLRETDGMGADLVCEAAGVPDTIASAFQTVRRAGRVILYGIPGDNDKIDFPVTHIITNQLEVHGAVGEVAVWQPLLNFVAAGRINLKDMITHRLPLDKIADGFEILKNKNENPIKVVILP